MLEESPRIWWQTRSDGTAVTIRTTTIVPDQVEAESRLAEAVAWLRSTLGSGALPSRLVIDQANAAGIAEITLRRAFKQLGGCCQKSTFDGCWVWELSESSELDHPGAGPPHEVDHRG